MTLPRRTELKRTGRLRPVSKRRQKRDAEYERARANVYERSGGRCEVRVAFDCTGRCEQVHHIAGRGGPDPHRQSNLLGVDRACHELIHAYPGWARTWGYMASRVGGAA